MRRWACATVLALSAPAFSHRLDEYLQLTALSLGRRSVEAKMILTPGVAVAKRVIGLIDANGDGLLSEGEKRAYAARVLRDVSLAVDGAPLRPRVAAFRFPALAAMRQFAGEIEIDLAATVTGRPGDHRLVFENRHQRPIAAYLVECYAPSDDALKVTGQTRSPEQARYELRYAQSGTAKPGLSSAARR